MVVLAAAGLLLAGLGTLRLTRPERYPARARGRLMAEGQGGFQHTSSVKYLFTVDGQRFTIEGDVGDPERLIDVWYDPADPRDCSFQPERSSLLALVATLLGGACLLAAGGVFMFSRP